MYFLFFVLDEYDFNIYFMPCRAINFKFTQTGGIATQSYYDMVDNEGNFVFQQLTGLQLLAGFTYSISSTAVSFTLTTIPQSASWSTCNPNPTVVGATLSSVYKGTNLTLSGGNLVVTNATANIESVLATIGKKRGKWYFEMKKAADTIGAFAIGVANTSVPVNTTYLGADLTGYGYCWDGYGAGSSYYKNIVVVSSAGQMVDNKWYGVALDLDNGKYWVYDPYLVVGWLAGGNPTTGANPLNGTNMLTGVLYPAVCLYQTGNFTANFGSSAFSNTSIIPSGYNLGVYGTTELATTWDTNIAYNPSVISGGGLVTTFAGTSMVISTEAHAIVGTGGNKYMYEMVITSGLNQTIGISKFPATFSTYPGGSSSLADSYGAYTFQFYLYHNGVPNTTAAIGYSGTPNVIATVLDTNAGTLQYYYNGVLVSYSSGTPVVTGLTGTWYAAVGGLGSTTMTAKFSNFTYPLSGVLGW